MRGVRCDAPTPSQVLRDGTRVAKPGRYRVRFGLRETAHRGMGFAEHSFVAL